MNLKKLCLISALSVGLITTSSITGFANSSYTSTLNMSVNSSVTGAYRDYKGSRHAIGITITSRDYHSDKDTNNCYIELQKQRGLTYDGQGSKLKNMPEIKKTYKESWSGQNDGKFRYYFTNFRVSGGDGFTSNKVEMSSN
ncbi:hypothetical protein [Clostridium formicaceticum]|uniref:Uncharacterized protein n=1 Tax=Clostridium formicaceticum TaxID=1497 RepID=A0AAC9RLF6_9CLOT|nr:hypothetical protein [Clostridium formicaceticum]AOY77587.1 hypothetical protein BJL90_18030 [Clostridium formicaceticum]ARE88166.1 hypothetical protein CLFO_25670 [Clostridium formicaceticum]